MMFTGTMIAPGIAYGPAAVWTPANTLIPKREVPPAAVPVEKKRLDHALRRARRELEEIALRVELTAGKSAANIFRAHEAILEDNVFNAAILKRIEEEKLAAESAVAVTVEEYRLRIATLRNEYLAARADDIVDFFFLSHSHPPSEEEQYEFYSGIVDAMAPHRVTFRTFDLGADKMAGTPATPEANPMLGCRGVRVLLEHYDEFTAHMRALLRASAHGPVRIMFPLVTSLTEFQDTIRVVDMVKRRLKAEGIPFDDGVPFGCMMETPAAATIPDILATEVEFFSIGSKDLIQYTLAADRTNPRVTYIYEPLHLAILRMMRTIVRAGHRRDRPVSLCGEMASDPIYTMILLGLGVDELSVNPAMVPAIKQIIRGVTSDEARELARGVLRERRAQDVQSYLEKMMSSRFPQVMSVYGRFEREDDAAKLVPEWGQ